MFYSNKSFIENNQQRRQDFQQLAASSHSCVSVCVSIRRDEQYRIMWNELETLVKTHAGDTDRHQRVLDCIIACRSKPPEEEDRKKRGRKREDREDRTEKNGSKDTEDKSWQDSERSVMFDFYSLQAKTVNGLYITSCCLFVF